MIRRLTLSTLVFMCVGCGSTGSPVSAPSSLSGTATWRERMALPPDAVFEATLEDVSRADAPSILIASTRIVHLHQQPSKTDCLALFKKQFLLAESFGALLRKWKFGLRQAPYSDNWTHHLAKYLYPLLLATPFAPKTVGVALLVLTNFTHLEAWRIKSPKTLVMLLLNPLLFLTGAIATARGFLAGKQRYSVFK